MVRSLKCCYCMEIWDAIISFPLVKAVSVYPVLKGDKRGSIEAPFVSIWRSWPSLIMDCYKTKAKRLHQLSRHVGVDQRMLTNEKTVLPAARYRTLYHS